MFFHEKNQNIFKKTRKNPKISLPKMNFFFEKKSIFGSKFFGFCRDFFGKIFDFFVKNIFSKNIFLLEKKIMNKKILAPKKNFPAIFFSEFFFSNSGSLISSISATLEHQGSSLRHPTRETIQ